jgi:hypothetical protein
LGDAPPAADERHVAVVPGRSQAQELLGYAGIFGLAEHGFDPAALRAVERDNALAQLPRLATGAA